MKCMERIIYDRDTEDNLRKFAKNKHKELTWEIL